MSLVRDGYAPHFDLERCGEPDLAARFLHAVLAGSYQEEMGALLLDSRQRAIGYHIAYRGTLNRVAVEPRGFLVPSLLANAAGYVAFHNHPSGDPTPSAEDVAFTRRLNEASEVVGVNLLDHIILGERPRYVSLRQRGGW